MAFGSVAASSFTVVSATQIVATAPAEAAGTIGVSVTTGAGTTGTPNFTYITTPSISAINPGTGPTAGGSVVTISGSNFTGLRAVNFGGVASSFTVNSDTQITATAPPHAAGTVNVTVSNGSVSFQLRSRT